MNIIRVLVYGLFALTIQFSYAQETEQNTENQTDQEQAESNNRNTESEVEFVPPPVASEDENFVPSEEISEDLSVSFPTDI